MAGEIQSYRDLIAWQKAYAFGKSIHSAALLLPQIERYALQGQMLRGSISVASNIAEGYGRGTTPDYLRFLRTSRGALFELDTQMLFARDFGYITTDMHSKLADQQSECGRVLAGLIRSLENRPDAND